MNAQTFFNNSGETIPPWAVIELDGTADVGGNKVLNAVNPNTASSTTQLSKYRINGGFSVPDGKTGQCFAPFAEQWVRVESGTPAAGELWGPETGSWGIKSGKRGFVITGGYESSRVRARYLNDAAASEGAVDSSGCCGGSVDRRLAVNDIGGGLLVLDQYQITDQYGTHTLNFDGGMLISEEFDITCDDA